MARLVWKLKTVGDALELLYALVESHYWSIEKLSMWVDEKIEQIERPSYWLLDLSSSISKGEDFEGSIFRLLENEQKNLSSNIYELCLGFVLLRYDAAQITAENAKEMIADFVDPSGVAGIQIEDVSPLSLQDPKLESLRLIAKDALQNIQNLKFENNDVFSRPD